MSSKEKEIDIREVFSQNLKYYRIKSNISQEKLSEIAKLNFKNTERILKTRIF